MDKRDSDGFFSLRLVCMDSDSSCNKADSLLTVANWSSIPCQCVPYICATYAVDDLYLYVHARPGPVVCMII